MARLPARVVAKGAEGPEIKPVKWVGDSRRIVQGFPEEVKDGIGVALFWAQKGTKHDDAKALRGFGDAQVIEIIEDLRGDTYRAVYTVRIEKFVCVLHAFQKKSKKDDKTPKHDIELIRKRLIKVLKMYKATSA